MNEDQILAEHLSSLGSLIHQLEAVRTHVDENYKKAVLLTSTKGISHYSEILHVMHVAREVTYDRMTAILIDEDRCIKELEDSTVPTSHAFLSKFKGKQTSKPPKCNSCKKLGHTEDKCYKKIP